MPSKLIFPIAKHLFRIQVRYHEVSMLMAKSCVSLFVAHKGKKELVVSFSSGNRYTVDFGSFAEQMTGRIHENVSRLLQDFLLVTYRYTTLGT